MSRTASNAPSPRVLELHAAACERGEAGYIDPDTGLFVLTSFYLAGRGRCCGNGCRHCPWPADVQTRAGRPASPCFPWRAGGSRGRSVSDDSE